MGGLGFCQLGQGLEVVLRNISILASNKPLSPPSPKPLSPPCPRGATILLVNVLGFVQVKLRKSLGPLINRFLGSGGPFITEGTVAVPSVMK